MLIVIEGPDGSGKGTVAACLSQLLEDRTRRPWPCVADPSHGPTGALVRTALATRDVDPRAMVYLFAADRLVAFPSEKSMPDAISERYMLSTVVYQSEHTPYWLMRGLLCDERLRRPTLTIVLSCNLCTCKQRLASRGRLSERYEEDAQLAAANERYEAVLAGDYLQMPVLRAAQVRNMLCGDIHAVDATRALEHVVAAVAEIARAYIPEL